MYLITENKLNGLIRKHFGKHVIVYAKLRIHNIISKKIKLLLLYIRNYQLGLAY